MPILIENTDEPILPLTPYCKGPKVPLQQFVRGNAVSHSVTEVYPYPELLQTKQPRSLTLYRSGSRTLGVQSIPYNVRDLEPLIKGQADGELAELSRYLLSVLQRHCPVVFSMQDEKRGGQELHTGSRWEKSTQFKHST